MWTVLAGAARVTVDGEAAALMAGDTIVLPAGATRRIAAEAAFEALVASRAGARVSAEGHDGVTPPWVA